MKYLKNVSIRAVMIAILVSAGFVSCSDDDSEDNNGSANLTVRMTDAPGDYDAVFVDVKDIKIQIETEGESNVDGEIDSEGWMSLSNVNAGIYDLLELTGGVSQLLADTEVPAGYVSQMRLILGSENSVVINGATKPLNTPSAQQSGLKLQLNKKLEAGENYSFLLDFDVDQSIVTTGNGGYNLKPVIRLNAEENAGMVVGKTIIPAGLEMNVQSLVKLQNSSVTISAYTDAEGNFALNGVPAGTYDLTITPQVSSGLTVYSMTDVKVKPNETTDLGEIEL
ncbi:DUF4382 domain-containing protein [Christiangramia aquimixticola]|uniref:DUF4382 domain-containing protein n=1 Tax=Christiangramia aquimixticola TaxID=1697558 RepID=UPI003AA7B94B